MIVSLSGITQKDLLNVRPPGTYCAVELALALEREMSEEWARLNLSVPCNADRKTLRPVAEAKVLGSVERRSVDEAIVSGGVNDARESR